MIRDALQSEISTRLEHSQKLLNHLAHGVGEGVPPPLKVSFVYREPDGINLNLLWDATYV